MHPTRLLACALLVAAPAFAAEIVVPMAVAEPTGIGAPIGHVRIVETPYGVVFYPQLKGLKPGLHGFHVHENASCEPAQVGGSMVAAAGAGGHLDPGATKRHGEPWGDGHLGDLPALYVAPDGSAVQPVLAPRLRLPDLQGHALVVHAGGDNHADHPAPLGGGGARVACGVIAG